MVTSDVNVKIYISNLLLPWLRLRERVNLFWFSWCAQGRKLSSNFKGLFFLWFHFCVPPFTWFSIFVSWNVETLPFCARVVNSSAMCNCNGDATEGLLPRGATTKVFSPNYSDDTNNNGVSPYQKLGFCIFLLCFLS